MVRDVRIRDHIDEKGESKVKIENICSCSTLKRQRVIKFLNLLMILIFFLNVTQAQQTPPPVGISEKLGQFIPLDVELYNESGNLIQLKSLISKPTIFMFVYYKCPGICSPLLNEVAKIVEKMDLELGIDYQIVTLSFDADEKPELAADKKDNYISLIKRKIDPNGWHFLTGDSVNIHRLTDAAGFYFQKNGRDWIHAGVLIVVSPQGKIARYLNGIQHLPFDVKMALMEAAEGRTGPTIAKVLSFCFTYDSEGKRYAFDFVRVSGVIVIGLVALFVVVFVLRKPKK
jgi:protein SCO1/2